MKKAASIAVLISAIAAVVYGETLYSLFTADFSDGSYIERLEGTDSVTGEIVSCQRTVGAAADGSCMACQIQYSSLLPCPEPDPGTLERP
jgi:hypothetical protein